MSLKHRPLSYFTIFLFLFLSCSICCAFSTSNSVVVDAGHGGTDSGAVGDNYLEKDWNLDTARACANELVRYGVYVYETRTDDTYISLEDRANLANNNNVDYFISIHHNSSNGDGDRGEVIYSIRSEESRQLANNIEEELRGIGQTDVKVYYKLLSNGRTDYYSVLRNTKMSAVIIEVCFIDNPEDRQIADTKEERERNGIAIAHGILKQLGIPTEIASDAIETRTEHHIISQPTASYDQLYNWAVNNNASETYLDNLKYIWDKSVQEGVNPVLVATQCALETDYMRSYIFKTHNNTAGIKQTSNTYRNYDTIHDGIDAQIEHLKLYAGTMDSDTGSWLWGWCPTVEGLAGRWAEDPQYSNKILSMMTKVEETEGKDEPILTDNEKPQEEEKPEIQTKPNTSNKKSPLEAFREMLESVTTDIRNPLIDILNRNKDKNKDNIDKIKDKFNSL